MPNSTLAGSTTQTTPGDKWVLVDSSGRIITSPITGVGATDLGKAEDAPHTSGDTGVEILAVRTDTPVARAADGDYHVVELDALGRVWVDPAGATARVSQVPTVSTSPAYTANDCVGGKLTFAGMSRLSGGGGTLTDVLLIDYGNQKAAGYLVLFNADFTAGSDNGAWNPTESDFTKLVGVIPILASDYVTQGSASLAVAHIRNLALAYLCNATSLFGQFWTTGTPTYTAVTDIEIVIKSKLD